MEKFEPPPTWSGRSLWNLDSTTDGDVVIDGGSAGSALADNSADPYEGWGAVAFKEAHARASAAGGRRDPKRVNSAPPTW